MSKIYQKITDLIGGTPLLQTMKRRITLKQPFLVNLNTLTLPVR